MQNVSLGFAIKRQDFASQLGRKVTRNVITAYMKHVGVQIYQAVVLESCVS